MSSAMSKHAHKKKKRVFQFLASESIAHLLNICAHSLDIELNTGREIPYLQATMYYFVHYINILLTKNSRLNARFKKRTRCHSFMALNRASDMSAADWRSQHTREKLS